MAAQYRSFGMPDDAGLGSVYRRFFQYEYSTEARAIAAVLAVIEAPCKARRLTFEANKDLLVSNGKDAADIIRLVIHDGATLARQLQRDTARLLPGLPWAEVVAAMPFRPVPPH